MTCNPISKEDFMNLSVLERAALVLEFGGDLMQRTYLCHHIRLYAVGDFYVELWYRYPANKIDRLEVVELNDVLPYYEKDINISNLFDCC
ncbi:MAG TPA: hypothetical protein VLH16_06135 [Bacteroidales bacterium]|nr:hypothetical protein [Bacteroidales bacterium]